MGKDQSSEADEVEEKSLNVWQNNRITQVRRQFKLDGTIKKSAKSNWLTTEQKTLTTAAARTQLLHIMWN